MPKATSQRLIGVCAVFFALLGLLWIRCLWLQVVSASRFSRMAAAQHVLTRALVAPRGTLYDRNGVVLAMSVRAPSVFANPRHVVAKTRTAIRLAKLIDQDPEFISQRLSRDKGFVWLARHVDPAIQEALQPFRREGIGLLEEPQRMYPQGRLAAHLLGDVDIDQKGLEGLELAFNGVLRGYPGWESTLRDARGQALLGPWTVRMEPASGYEAVLTLDSVVQGAVEEALAWGVEKFHAKGGSVIVMDPQTGDILALANQPTFDPNQPGRVPAENRRNRAITDLFEPGSVFKIVTASALLEEGLVHPNERFFCEEGSYRTVGRHVLHDHRPHGWLTFHEAIQYSSNIGTTKAAQRLAPEVLYRYIRAFGFGKATALELPGEVSGMIAPPTKWSKLSPFIIPIGHEVAVTPIQLAVMTAVIANGGWRVRPRLVARLQTSTGETVRRYDRSSRERILRAETADVLQEMLISVVESGTGQLANIQGLTVAGKTGTAQKLEPNGRYSHSRYVASFVGYGPVPDPRFVMVVTIDESKPAYFGGVVSAPVFRRVVEKLMGYWDLKTPQVATHTIARLP